MVEEAKQVSNGLVGSFSIGPFDRWNMFACGTRDVLQLELGQVLPDHLEALLCTRASKLETPS